MHGYHGLELEFRKSRCLWALQRHCSIGHLAWELSSVPSGARRRPQEFRPTPGWDSWDECQACLSNGISGIFGLVLCTGSQSQRKNEARDERMVLRALGLLLRYEDLVLVLLVPLRAVGRALAMSQIFMPTRIRWTCSASSHSGQPLQHSSSSW